MPPPSSSLSSECHQVQLAHESVDNTHRIVRSDEVIQTLWQQCDLLPVLPFNESRHIGSKGQYVRELYRFAMKFGRGFSHSLGRNQPDKSPTQ